MGHIIHLHAATIFHGGKTSGGEQKREREREKRERKGRSRNGNMLDIWMCLRTTREGKLVHFRINPDKLQICNYTGFRACLLPIHSGISGYVSLRVLGITWLYIVLKWPICPVFVWQSPAQHWTCSVRGCRCPPPSF